MRISRCIVFWVLVALYITGCKSTISDRKTNGIIAVIDSFMYPGPVKAPFPFPEIEVPDIPNKRFNIVDYGAQSGGEADCSDAIKSAIQAASKAGGGIVVIPQGEWLTGPVHLESNINLYLDEGAKVLFSQKFSDYLPAVLWRHEGIEVYSYSPFIYALNEENIAITGKGVFEGRGKAWWEYRLTEKQKYYAGAVMKLQQMGENGIPVEERVFDSLGYKFLCPPFVVPFRCKNIWIEGVTFNYGAFWTIVPTYCENVVVRNVTINTYGEYGHTPNGDGVNPSSCKNVLIENCILDTGDDCIAIKSGKNKDGRRIGIPTENVVVRNVTGYRGHGGVVIGSEISGGVKNIYAYNCNFNGTDRMIRIKAERGRGGYVKNAWYKNMMADTIEREAIHLNLLYSGERLPVQLVDETTPVFENIHIKNITCRYSRHNAIRIVGIPEMMIRDVFIDSINILADKGIEITDAKDIHLTNIQVNPVSTELLKIEFSNSIEVSGIHTSGVANELTPILINHSKNIHIADFTIGSKHKRMINIMGNQSDSIFLDKSSFNKRNVKYEEGIEKEVVTFQ